jgi:hypothetical protein
MTFSCIIGWMVISVVFGVALVPLLVVAGVMAISIPIVSYPLTYCVWQGIDLFIRPPSQEDIAQAEEWLKVKS